MKIDKLYIVMGLIIAFSLLFGLTAYADEYDESSTLTFSQPIQIPGKVLPAGTYVFTLASSSSDRHIVHIFNVKRNVLYATLQTVPTVRRDTTNRTAVALAKQGAGQPDVLLKWFYPEEEAGNEFLYPKQEEKQLAQDKQRTIVANQSTASNTDTAGAGN